MLTYLHPRQVNDRIYYRPKHSTHIALKIRQNEPIFIK